MRAALPFRVRCASQKYSTRRANINFFHSFFFNSSSEFGGKEGNFRSLIMGFRWEISPPQLLLLDLDIHPVNTWPSETILISSHYDPSRYNRRVFCGQVVNTKTSSLHLLVLLFFVLVPVSATLDQRFLKLFDTHSKILYSRMQIVKDKNPILSS